MRLGFSWLDFKVGFRMLVRYPGLTLVGGLAMAFAIWAGAGAFEFVTQVISPTLPLDDGDRIVGIQNRDASSAGVDPPTLHDFVTWREELDAVEDLGAFRTVERNLIGGEGRGEPVEAAEMSASGFEVARVSPLLGRPLLEADGRPGAAPVAVLGHDLWRRHFAGDPDIVGRTVRLGGEQTTVVGVMPEGFAFPISHGLWLPLRLDPLDYERGESPEAHVFGRLAPGATLGEAQAELARLGRRAAADFPDTHRHLRPTVLPYAESIFPIRLEGMVRAGAYSIGLLGVLLIVLMCSNVALLMFARAASRESELAVRHALGAGRGRIIAQLFAEALVLGGVAAVVGLAGVQLGLAWFFDTVIVEILDGWRLPFWLDPGLSPVTVLYAVALTLLGAAIAGVVPGLKATRGGVQARLRKVSAGGGGFRFGGVWTAVIVAQVALTVFLPVFAWVVQRDVVRLETADVGFAEEEYLGARLELDRRAPPGAHGDTAQAAFVARATATARALERRLLAEPVVAGVTFADRLPRMYHPWALVEVDGGGAAPLDPRWRAYRVSSVSVAPDYFEVLGAPILRGRGFRTSDAAAGAGEAGVVVVNESFVDRVLGGRNPLGRRVRYELRDEADAVYSAEEPGPWHEIVGVVPDLGTNLGVSSAEDPKSASVYHPVAPGAASPLHVAVHVRGNPGTLVPRLSRLAAAVDPSLRLHDVTPLDELSDSALAFLDFWLGLIALVIGITLVLSLAGVYAVTSFTVSQRRREIGIRVALGADRRRLVLAVFRRPIARVALGIGLGVAPIAALVLGAAEGVEASIGGAGVVAAYAALMLSVCLAACVVPTRRALAIEPTEALKADG